MSDPVRALHTQWTASGDRLAREGRMREATSLRNAAESLGYALDAASSAAYSDVEYAVRWPDGRIVPGSEDYSRTWARTVDGLQLLTRPVGSWALASDSPQISTPTNEGVPA